METSRTAERSIGAAALSVHVLLGAYCASLVRWSIALSQLNTPAPGPSLPPNVWESLGTALAAAVALGAVTLIANTVAMRAVRLRSRRMVLLPPAAAAGIVLLGGLIGTLELMRGSVLF